jgi:transcriptional regulator GlxA family with amidase domain
MSKPNLRKLLALCVGLFWAAAASYLTGRMAAAFWLAVAGIFAFVGLMLWAGEE